MSGADRDRQRAKERMRKVRQTPEGRARDVAYNRATAQLRDNHRKEYEELVRDAYLQALRELQARTAPAR